MLSVLPSRWCSIVTNSIGADFVVGHSLSQPEVVKSIRFGFESKKGTTYCNVFAIGLTLRRFIRFKCILAINSGSMQVTDVLTKVADESRLHYPWIRSLMSQKRVAPGTSRSRSGFAELRPSSSPESLQTLKHRSLYIAIRSPQASHPKQSRRWVKNPEVS